MRFPRRDEAELWGSGTKDSARYDGNRVKALPGHSRSQGRSVSQYRCPAVPAPVRDVPRLLRAMC